MYKIKSFLLRFKIETERVFVHGWRRIVGFPLKRSVVVSEKIYVGGQFKISKLNKLLDWGITAVVSMRKRYPKELDSQEKVAFLNLPTTDLTAPTIDQLKKGVSFIQQQIDEGGRVYIHCHMGEGRGPTMASAYFISQGMTIDDAIESITKIRPFLDITNPQREVLEKFAKYYSKIE